MPYLRLMSRLDLFRHGVSSLVLCFPLYYMFVFVVMPYLRLISCCLPLLSCLILCCLVLFRSLISASYYVVWLCISIFFFIWMPYLRLTLCFLLLLCFFLLHYVVCPWYTLLFLQSIILFTFLFLPFPHLMLCRFCLRFHALFPPSAMSSTPTPYLRLAFKSSRPNAQSLRRRCRSYDHHYCEKKTVVVMGRSRSLAREVAEVPGGIKSSLGDEHIRSSGVT